MPVRTSLYYLNDFRTALYLHVPPYTVVCTTLYRHVPSCTPCNVQVQASTYQYIPVCTALGITYVGTYWYVPF
jgi:hypothetical protein